ncbi:MAG: FliG C-terminal domain-containing protein [Planctomycetia bacterium]|jgi:flagellar motor switch protein FliG
MKSTAKTTIDPGLRKAAILIGSLERKMADGLLAQMGPERAKLVRDAIMNLGPIDPAEEEQVLVEFFRTGPADLKKKMKTSSRPSRSERRKRNTDEADEAYVRKLVERSKDIKETNEAVENSKNHKSKPLGFLRETDTTEIVRILANERPQTIALVLSHLPAEQAAAVLDCFSAKNQTEVIRRLVELEETDREILEDIEITLKSRMKENVPVARRRVVGAKAVDQILSQGASGISRRILDNLAKHDPKLAQRFLPKSPEPEKQNHFGPLTFSDVTRLQREALKTLINTAGIDLIMIALVGAPDSFIERVLETFPTVQAEAIRHELSNLAPTRLSDVETAQRQLADLTRVLALSGHIELPPTMQRPMIQVTA